MSAPSSDTPKMVSEREAVERERTAFVVGARWQHDNLGCDYARTEDAARKNYSHPKVERPRVVRDSHGDEWRICGGVLELRDGPAWRKQLEDGWKNANDAVAEILITLERVRLWSDLLARPTELVDDEEAGS